MTVTPPPAFPKSPSTDRGAARRLVALDVDGTIVDFDGNLDDELAAAIRTLDSDPHTEVVIATGRSVDAALAIVEQLRIRPTWVVAANGAMVLRRDTLAERAYRREYVETFDSTAVLTKVRPHLVNARYAVEDGEGRIWHTAFIPDTALPRNHRDVPFEDLLGIQASRVVVSSPEHSIDEFQQIVSGIGLSTVTYAIGHTAWLDLAPHGVTKASGLQKVNHQLGIDRTRMFCAGDGDNDRDMLQWIGQHGEAVVMGQASDTVKSWGTSVTGTVYENGLLTALRAWHPLLGV